ncbi:MAG: pentapeptide repeat-containing protein [Candidatus Dojkabacteria bacterium]|nr:pentapeptide repeat-containing protein [Candidatus Dojkabacteria bacterium]MDQ7020349.1 pentapeptide repeat-containing protein [Candidatus Dojkabacteria bacterium]
MKLFDRNYYENEVFEEISLDISKTDFNSVTFKNCDFSEKQLKANDFIRCKFINCNFLSTDFTDSKLEEPIFKSCRLSGMNWSRLRDSLHSKYIFEQCDLRFSAFVDKDFFMSEFNECKINESEFDSCKLNKTKFSSDLLLVSFKNCELNKADFSRSKNVFIDLVSNKVKGMKLSDRQLEGLIGQFGVEVVEDEY